MQIIYLFDNQLNKIKKLVNYLRLQPLASILLVTKKQENSTTSYQKK